jgi:Ca-activated chloride channel family protein
VRFTNLALLASVAPDRPGWRRHVGAALLGLALVAMVVSLARPTHEVRVARTRAVVIMAIDVSLSMKSTDVAPTRLAAAQAAASDFARSLPETVRLGLVSFAGTATVEVPATTDHLAVVAAVKGLQLQERTAIGDAVLTSLAAVRAATAGETGARAPASIALMSDGTTTTGTPDDVAAAAAKQAGVPVTTIAFGTEGGTVQVGGETVAVPVGTAALADLARATGGKAFTAKTGSQLRAAFRNIGGSVGYKHERREATTAFLGAAIVLALLAAAASLRWTARLP